MNTEPPLENLIYDWNTAQDNAAFLGGRTFELHDETLRDGVQNPSVIDPPVADKIEILHILNEMGVSSVDVGLPGAGPRHFQDVVKLCREIVTNRMAIRPCCAGRTLESDIRPMVDVSQRVGVSVEVMTFIGSSPIRRLAEDWSVELIRKRSVEAIGFAVKEGLPVTYVTEDTTRSNPDVLSVLFRAAMDHGATRICLCDTVGHATPNGVRNLIAFTKKIVRETGTENIRIDWHGHNDRGRALENALAALQCGADRVHGCILGIGERVGNTPLDLLLVNLKLLGALQDCDLSRLATLCEFVSKATQFPIPINYPVVGEDAFRTGTGVHAAAIIKAKGKGADFLADRVYSSVPASMVGREQEILIGHMSGASNVTYWLNKRGIASSHELIEYILEVAKKGDHLLSEDEVRAAVARFQK